MYGTAERVGMVKKRIRERNRQRVKRSIRRLSVLCAGLACVLAETVGAMTDYLSAEVPGMYGSILLYGGAGGYVLTGVAAFFAAAALTVFCIRISRGKKIPPEEGREP